MSHVSRWLPSLLVPLALFGAAPLAGQEAEDTVHLQEIVVTATRLATPATQVVAATTVISGEELRERGVQFVQDALRQVPGATIVPTGSYGGTTSLFLRGGESDYVKVLVDGVPVNQPGGSFDFASLTTENLDRIEVVRGPASVLYGSDAVTGVVQIFTRTGAGGMHGEFVGRAGSFGTRYGAAALSGGGEQTSYAFSLGRQISDGIYAFNSGFRNTVGSALVSLRPDQRTDLHLSARTGDDSFHFPTDFAGVPVDSNQFTYQNGVTLGLDAGRRVSPRTDLRLFLVSNSATMGSENQPDNAGDTLGFYSQSQTRMLRQSADARANWAPGLGTTLTLGGQAEFQSLHQTSGSNFGIDAPFDARRRNLGVYAQGILALGARTVVNLGARLDHNEKFGAHGTYRGGLVYRLGRATRLRASIGSAFKEPTFNENFARSPFERGNPSLRPERTTSWEIGWEQDLVPGMLLLTANYFDQRFRNLIQYDGVAPPTAPTYQNVARATSRGLETSLRVTPRQRITLRGSYTYLKTRVDDAGFSTAPGDLFVEGKRLIRRPGHSLQADARVRPVGPLRLGMALNYVGKRDDVDFGPFPSVRVELPAYTTVDADAEVDLTTIGRGRPGITATVRAENLFDRKYSTVVGFPGRKRAVFVGTRIGL